jgi:hypothetical protein
MFFFFAHMLMFKDDMNVSWLFEIIELEPNISTHEEEFHIPTTRAKDATNHTHIEGQERFGEIVWRELTQILGTHRHIM